MADARSLLTERLSKLRADAYQDVDITDSKDRPSGLVVRYQSIGQEEFGELQRRHEDDPVHEFNVSIVIRACQALLMRHEDGRLTSIDVDDPDGAYVDDNGKLHGKPITYSSDRTLELLGVEGPREAVRELHEHAELLVDSEAATVVNLSGAKVGGGAGPERRSRASRS